jgi:hypothetical protein
MGLGGELFVFLRPIYLLNPPNFLFFSFSLLLPIQLPPSPSKLRGASINFIYSYLEGNQTMIKNQGITRTWYRFTDPTMSSKSDGGTNDIARLRQPFLLGIYMLFV